MAAVDALRWTTEGAIRGAFFLHCITQPFRLSCSNNRPAAGEVNLVPAKALLAVRITNAGVNKMIVQHLGERYVNNEFSGGHELKRKRLTGPLVGSW